VGYSFVVSFILVKVIDVVWGFCLENRSETEGLDRSEHGETGFDFGLALESASEQPMFEPRPANVPPDGHERFTVVVEGAKNGDLMQTWSELCQTGPQPPTSEFRTVYPYLTTVQGNRFRFRGGDPKVMQENLQRLFENRLGNRQLKVHLENN